MTVNTGVKSALTRNLHESIVVGTIECPIVKSKVKSKE